MTSSYLYNNDIKLETIELGPYIDNNYFYLNTHGSFFKVFRSGKILIFILCGITAKEAGDSKIIVTLPEYFIEGYCSTTISTTLTSDTTYNSGIRVGVFTHFHYQIRAHIPSNVVGKELWGEMIIPAGSYFD